MDNTKLTVRIPRDWLDGAKKYAKANNTTITRLVSEFLRRLSIQEDFLADAPTVQRLSGILSEDMSTADYEQYLEDKYGK